MLKLVLGSLISSRRHNLFSAMTLTYFLLLTIMLHMKHVFQFAALTACDPCHGPGQINIPECPSFYPCLISVCGSTPVGSSRRKEAKKIEAMLPYCLLLLFRAHIPLLGGGGEVKCASSSHCHTLQHLSINCSFYFEKSGAVKQQTRSQKHFSVLV